MFRTNAPCPQFHTSVVSANTEHDHFGLYITSSDTRECALNNAMDHLLQQIQRTGAQLSSNTRVLVATGGRLGPASYIAARTGGRVVAACSTDSVTISESNDRVSVVRVDSPDAVFTHDEGTFDIVVSVDGLASANDKRGLITNAFRVLKEGGLFAVMDVMARPAARREHLAPFEKAMEIPALITLHSYEKMVEEAGFVLMRTCDLSAHVVMSYRQVIAKANELNEGIGDCNRKDINQTMRQLEEDIGRMREDGGIGWASFVALKMYSDERDGKIIVD